MPAKRACGVLNRVTSHFLGAQPRNVLVKWYRILESWLRQPAPHSPFQVPCHRRKSACCSRGTTRSPFRSSKRLSTYDPRHLDYSYARAHGRGGKRLLYPVLTSSAEVEATKSPRLNMKMPAASTGSNSKESNPRIRSHSKRSSFTCTVASLAHGRRHIHAREVTTNAKCLCIVPGDTPQRD